MCLVLVSGEYMAVEDMQEYQFQKGHHKVGGRKKGSLNFNTRLERKLKQKITYKDRYGKEITKKGIDHVIDGFIKRGAKGDPKVTELLYKWFEGDDPMQIILTLSEMSNEQLEAIAQGKRPDL